MPTVTPQPAQVMIPQQRGGSLICPRCNGRLLHDGANLLCVLCGYEYGVAQYLAHRDHPDRETTLRPLKRVA